MNALTTRPDGRPARQRIDAGTTADPTPDSVFLDGWLCREARRYRELLRTVAAAPRPSTRPGL